MAIVIGQIITEVAVAPKPEASSPAPPASTDDTQIDLIVRRATERVLEILRREWDR
jgi:hypothetical protein